MNAPGKVVAEGRSRREPVPAAKARRPAGARAGRRENREAGDRAVALIVLVRAQEIHMLDGVILLWFVLAALSVSFVAIDIRNTPESPVLKWGFVLLTAYTGVVGAFLYVLGCREPLAGTHEQYTAARWRQTLGSTMHCVAGDGVGILVGAVLSSLLGLTGLREVALEYLLGFGYGWTISRRSSCATRRGLLRLGAEAHLHPRASVDEFSDGRDGPDRHDA